jgi:hypothetical protein
MLYREIIAVCSEIHTKHINTLCGQNVEFVNVKPGGTQIQSEFKCFGIKLRGFSNFMWETLGYLTFDSVTFIAVSADSENRSV